MGSAGKHIPDPGFAGDAGGADHALAAALVGYAAGEVGDQEVLAALVGARVLVPVVAVRSEEQQLLHPTDPRQEKTTDMALVTLVGRDGRRAMPAFTSLSRLTGWRPDARPVPVEASRAALSAVAEGAEVLVLDVAGPHRFDVTGAALEALARGRAWVPPHGDPEVREVVEAAVAAEPTLAAVRVSAGDNGSVRVSLEHVAGANPAEIAAAARAVATRLAGDDLVRDRARSGLDLVVVPPPADPSRPSEQRVRP